MLYPYDLPESNRPDLMIVLDASHAEAFNRAARAASTTMGFMMQSQGILGLLKSPQFYNVGPIDFKNNVVTGASIEEFGDHLLLNDQRTTITELRNQLNGHIRAALNDIMSAVGITTINLIFCAGGPLVILPPSPYRIALLRFEDAKSVKEERQCVIANKASRIAYQTAWNMLDELIMKHRPPVATPSIEDVLDEPPSIHSPGLNLVSGGGMTQFARSDHEDLDEEDQIDEMSEQDEPEDNVADEDDAVPPEGQSGGTYDEYANMQF
jgi:hypothetical protein